MGSGSPGGRELAYESRNPGFDARAGTYCHLFPRASLFTPIAPVKLGQTKQESVLSAVTPSGTFQGKW